MSLGKRLKSRLKELNITQKAFAERLNMPLSTLNGFITDYREPDIETLRHLANELEIDIKYLILGDISAPPTLADAKKENTITDEDIIAMMKRLDWLDSDFPIAEENMTKFKKAVKAVADMYSNGENK